VDPDAIDCVRTLMQVLEPLPRRFT